MEFRIAPMIMAIFNLIFIAIINPDLNSAISLSSVSNIWKFAALFAIIFFMSIGEYARHSYYSNKFKMGFYAVQVINVILLAAYIYAIQRQHLG